MESLSVSRVPYYHGLDSTASMIAKTCQQPPSTSPIDPGYPQLKTLSPIGDDALVAQINTEIAPEVDQLYSSGWLTRYVARMGFHWDRTDPVFLLLVVKEGSMTQDEAAALISKFRAIFSRSVQHQPYEKKLKRPGSIAAA